MAKSVYQILIELEGDEQAKQAIQSLGTAAGLTGAALTAFAAGAGKLAADYQQSLANVATVSTEATGTTEEFSQALFSLQKDLNGAINVQEAATASYDILSAGIKDQEAVIEALGQSQKAAIAGQSDLNSISKAAVSIVNSYGDALGEGLTQAERFEKAINLTIQTQLDGVITGGEYAQQIGNIASLAKESGVKLESLNGIIATTTAKGTPAAQAFTKIQAAISNITRPSEKAREEAKRLGIEFDAARLQAVGFEGILEDIFNSDKRDAASIGKLFESTEAIALIQQLGGDLELVNQNIENQVNGLGALDQAYAELDETPIQRVTNALNLLQGSLIKIGQGVLVAFEPVLTVIAKLAAFISELPAPVLATVGAVAGLSGVALTAAGGVLLLATSIGAMKTNLEVGLPLLIKMVKSVGAMGASALSAAGGLKSFNLATLTSNAQLKLLATNAKATLVSMGPLLLTLGAFAGAAASVALVVDTFKQMDSEAKKNRDAALDLKEGILEINKATGTDGLSLVKDEELLKIEQIKEEMGGVQRFLDKIRGGALLELKIAKGSEGFAQLNSDINDLGFSIAQTAKDFENGLKVDPATVEQSQEQIKLIIETLKASNPVTQANIELRDQQIARFEGYSKALEGATKDTEDNTEATEEGGLTAEEAAKKYDEYAKQVTNSVKNIGAATQNSIDSLVGSETFRIQETLRLQEESTNTQVALLEDLKNQSQTTAQERVAIEIEIQAKQIELNKNRIEANKQLEENYRQFQRDLLEKDQINFELYQLANNKTVEESYAARKTLLENNFELEKSILEQKLNQVEKNSGEERTLLNELANLTLENEKSIAALDEELHQEKLANIQERTEAEQTRLDLVMQGQELEAMMLENSGAVLDSQASILGKISGLLDGDNATLAQRAELLSLAEQITGQTFQTNGNSSALDQAKIAIQNELNSIEIKKLDLKIKQLEIDKEQLRIAAEIKQLEIQGERDLIRADLQNGNLNSNERANLQRRDQALASQSNLESRRASLGAEAIDSQLGFAGLERQLAEILSRNNGTNRLNPQDNQFNISQGGDLSQGRLDSLYQDGLITAEEWRKIVDDQTKAQEERAKEQTRALESSEKEAMKTSENTSTLASTQDQTNTQISGQTEEIKNVSGSIGSLVQVSQEQLQIQRRMSARLDQISRQLDTLPTSIASRLPRPTPPVNSRR